MPDPILAPGPRADAYASIEQDWRGLEDNDPGEFDAFQVENFTLLAAALTQIRARFLPSRIKVALFPVAGTSIRVYRSPDRTGPYISLASGGHCTLPGYMHEYTLENVGAVTVSGVVLLYRGITDIDVYPGIP